MSKELNSPFVLFSLNGPNEVLEEEVVKSLGLPYKALRGSYDNATEKTYMVIIAGEDNTYSLDMNKLARVKDLAFSSDYCQECVLVVASSRDSILEYANGNTEHMGKFLRCDKAKALLHSCWTYDSLNDQYWMAEKTIELEVPDGEV